MSVRVTIYEDYAENKEAYWCMELDVLPRVGDRLVIASAPFGIWHKVESVEHHIGMGEQRIIIVAERHIPPGIEKPAKSDMWR